MLFCVSILRRLFSAIFQNFFFGIAQTSHNDLETTLHRIHFTVTLAKHFLDTHPKICFYQILRVVSKSPHYFPRKVSKAMEP